MDQGFKSILARLTFDPNDTESHTRCLQACKDLRDRIVELSHSNYYSGILAMLCPMIFKILSTVQPQRVANTQHQIRNASLDLLHRLPQNDVLRKFVPSLIDLATKALPEENEENAVLCLNILNDVLKSFRPTLEDSHLKPIFNFVEATYQAFPNSCRNLFSISAPVSKPELPEKLLTRSQESFKVLSECPLIAILIFQLNKQNASLPQYMSRLVPLMVECIRTKPSDEFFESKILDQNRDLREKYSLLLAAQVKTLTYVPHLLRSAATAEGIQRYSSSIATSVLQLLRGCLPESISVRKELLAATRHILASNLRTNFYDSIDMFLDESLLLGPYAGSFNGRPSPNGPMPLVPPREQPLLQLAYTTLGEFIQQVRNKLNLSQLSKVVYIFTRNLHDPNLSINMQLASVRVLLNLVETIFNNSEKESNSGRQLLVLILHGIITKFGSLRYYIPEVIAMAKTRRLKRFETASSGQSNNPLPEYFYVCPSSSASTGVAMKKESSPQKQVQEINDQRNVHSIKVAPLPSPSIAMTSNGPLASNSVSTQEEYLDGAKHGSKIRVDLDEILTIGKESPVNVGTDDIKDVQSLIETMLRVMRNALWGVYNYSSKKYEKDAKKVYASIRSNARTAPNMQRAIASVEKPTNSQLLTNTELQMLGDFMEWGFQCLAIFRPGVVEPEEFEIMEEVSSRARLQQQDSGDPAASGNQTPPFSSNSQTYPASGENSVPNIPGNMTKRQTKEIASELEVIQNFADIFIVLDPHNFMDLFRSKMNIVFANTIRHPTLIAFTKRLLKKPAMPHAYLRILLDLIIEKLPSMADVFGMNDMEMVAMPDLSNILPSNEDFPLSFKNVPMGGSEAASTLHGLGLESTQTKDGRCCRNIAEPPVVNSLNKKASQISFQERIVQGQVKVEQNYTSVLSQFIEVSFSCIEQYTDETLAGPAPHTLKQATTRSPTAPIQQSSGNPSPTSNARITPGWAIADNFQEKFEKLLVVCFILSSRMTSSTQASVRSTLSNPVVEAFLSDQHYGPLAKSLLNRQRESPIAVDVSILGRDCYLAIIKNFVYIILRRPILQELCKAKLELLLVPALNSLSHHLVQAEGKMKCSGSTRQELVAEIMLLFAVRIPKADVVKYLPLMRNAFEVALRANESRNVDLVRLALRILESWVDNLSSNVFRSLFTQNSTSSNQGNATFAHAIANLLKPSPQPCGTGALRLLGKLGSQARAALLSTPEFRTALSEDRDVDPVVASGRRLERVLVVDLLWESSGHGSFSKRQGIQFCLDQVIQTAKSFLTDTYAPLCDDSFCFPRTKIKSPSSLFSDTAMEVETENPDSCVADTNTGQNSIPKSGSTAKPVSIEAKELAALESHSTEYKEKAVDLLLAGAAHFIEIRDIAGIPDLGSPPKKLDAILSYLSGQTENIPFMNTPAAAASQGMEGRKLAERSLFIDVLDGLVTASCDVSSSAYTWPLFRGLLQILVLASIGNSVDASGSGEDVGLGVSGETTFDTGMHFEQGRHIGTVDGRRRASSVASEVEHQSFADLSEARSPSQSAAACVGFGLDPTVLNQSIVNSLSTACPVHTSLGLKMMLVVFSTGIQAVSANAPPSELAKSRLGPLLQDLVARCCDSCFSQKWTERLGGCIGLRYMISQLPLEWTQSNRTQISQALAFVLETHEPCFGDEVLYHTASGLQELILACFSSVAQRGFSGVAQTLFPTVDGSHQNRFSVLAPDDCLRDLLKALLSPCRQSRVIAKAALELVALCFGVSLGSLLQNQATIMAEVRTTLFSRPVKHKSPLMQVAFLDTISYILDQTPCPLDILGDEKRVVQTLVDAIMLAEAAERSTGGLSLSYIKCLDQCSYLTSVSTSFADQAGGRSTAKSAGNGLASVFRNGPYSFLDIPVEIQLRVAAIDIVRTFFAKGKVTILTILNKDTYQKVRDRAVKLVVSSALSSWPSVVRAAEKGLSEISAVSTIPVQTSSGMQEGIPQSVLNGIISSATKILFPAAQSFQPMLQGSIVITRHFPNHQNVPMIIKALILQLESTLLKLPDCDSISAGSHPQMESPLKHANLAAGIIRALADLPKSMLMDHWSSFIKHSIRILSAPERLTHMRFSASLQEFSDGKVTLPNTDGIINVQGLISSPLLPALVTMFNRFPGDMMGVILQPEVLKKQSETLRLLKSLLKLEEAGPLRKFVTGEYMTNKIVNTMLEIGSNSEVQSSRQRELALLAFQALDLVTVTIRYSPEWLVERPELIERIIGVWRSKLMLAYLRVEEKLSYSQRRYYSNVCQVFIAFFREVAQCAQRDEANGLQITPLLAGQIESAASCVYNLLTLAVLRTTVDTTFILRFFWSEVAVCKSTQLKLALLKHYIHYVNTGSFSHWIQEASLRLIVLPMISYATGPNGDPAFHTCRIDIGQGFLLGNELLREMVQSSQGSGRQEDGEQGSSSLENRESHFTLGPASPPPESLFQNSIFSKEGVQVQLFQLAALLIAKYSDELPQISKDLLKFAWNHLKSDCKSWAYLSISVFISVSKVPEKIILQVFLALLREHSSDSRDLIRKSLSMLSLSLARTLDAQWFTRAIHKTRKQILEEGHKIPQLTHIWQYVTQHPELFYQNRYHFVNQLISSFTKLWNPQGGQENRSLAIDLGELLLKWEETRCAEESLWKHLQATRQIDSVPLDELTKTQRGARDAVNGFKLNEAMITAVVNFFMRTSISLSGSNDPDSLALYRRCLNLFKLSLHHASRILKQNGEEATIQSQGTVSAANSPSGSPPAKKIINFGFLAKHIDQALKKQAERAQQAEKQAESSEKNEASVSSSGPQVSSASLNTNSNSSVTSSSGKLNRTGSSFIPPQTGAGGATPALHSTGVRPAAVNPAVASMNATAMAAAAAASQKPGQSSTAPATTNGQDPNNSAQSSSSEPSAILDLQEEEPGTLTCILELLYEIATADKETIAGPFVRENDRSLHVIIRPIFGCAERGARGLFLKLVVALRPLLSSYASQKSASAPLSTPNTSFIEQKGFYSVLFDAIDKRLVLAADDGKKASQAVQHVAKAQQTLQAAKQAKDSKKKKGTSAQGGAAPKAKSSGKAGKSVQADMAGSGGKGSKASKLPLPSKGAQQRAAKAAAVRKAKEIGAGPEGTLQTIRLVQALCLKNSPKIQSQDILASNFFESTSGGYEPKRVDRFANSLMKILMKLAKDITTSSVARQKNASKTANSIGGSTSILASAPRQRDEPDKLASRGVCLILEILSGRIFCHDQHRRAFLTQISQLIDRLDAHDEEVILTVIRLSSDWISAPLSSQPPKRKLSTTSASEAGTSGGKSSLAKTPSSQMASLVQGVAAGSTPPSTSKSTASKSSVTPGASRLSMKERQGLIAKLELLERFAGITPGKKIVQSYRDLIYKFSDPSSPAAKNRIVLPSQLESRFLPGLLSDDPMQRRQFFRAFMGTHSRIGKGPFPKLQLLIQQDWSHFGTSNWLPIAVQLLLGAVNPSTYVSCTSLSTVIPLPEQLGLVSPLANRQGIVKGVRSTLVELRKRKNSGIIIEAIQELAHGDKNCKVALASWLEIFPQAWNALEEQKKMILNEGLQVLLTRNYHLSESVVQFSGVQRAAVAGQYALEEISRKVLSQIKGWCISNDIARDPFQDPLIQGALRRTRSWDRLSDWGAPSILKCLLTSILLLRPVPILSPELIRYLGQHIGLKSEAIELSELLFQQVSGVGDSPSRADLISSLVLPTTVSSTSGNLTPHLLGSESFPNDPNKRRATTSSKGNVPVPVSVSSGDGNQSKHKRKRKDKKQGTDSAAAIAAAEAAAVAKVDSDKRNSQRWVDALLSLYQQNSDDLSHGLIRQWGVASTTFAGLSLEAVGKWEKAMQVYLQGMRRVEIGRGEYIVARTRPAQMSIDPYMTSSHAQGYMGYGFDNMQPMQQGAMLPGPVGMSMQPSTSGTFQPLSTGVNMVSEDDFMEFDDLNLFAGISDDFEDGVDPSAPLPIGGDQNQGIGGYYPQQQISNAPQTQQDMIGHGYSDHQIVSPMGSSRSNPDVFGGSAPLPAYASSPAMSLAWLPKQVSAPELRVWKDRWLHCAQKLGKWDLVNSVAGTMKDFDVMMESAARSKIPEWIPAIKPLIASQLQGLHELQTQTQQERPYLPHHLFPNLVNWRSSLLHIILAIHENRNTEDLDTVWRQGANSILIAWANNGGLLSGEYQRELLFATQQLVELEESFSYLANIVSLAGAYKSVGNTAQQAGSAATHPSDTLRIQLKRLLDRWRERVPHSGEEVYAADRILMSRLFVFSMAASSFEQHALKKIAAPTPSAPVETLTVAQLQVLAKSHDTKWTVLERAKSYRLNNLPDECVSILTTQWIVTSTISSEDKFRLASERALALLDSYDSANLRHYKGHLSYALNGLCDLNVSELVPKSSGEVFRLRAMVQDALGDDRGAVHGLFMDSISKDPFNKDTWLEWSAFANRLLHSIQSQENTWPTLDRDLGPIIVSGILQAVKLNSREARTQLGIVFWLLHVEAEMGQAANRDHEVLVGSVILNYMKIVPAWVWVPWIPQIVSLLSMSDESVRVGQKLVARVSSEYPDAVYYTLRAQYFEKDNEQRAANAASSNASDTSIVKNVREVLSKFHKDHPKLVQELEFVLEDLSTSFKNQHPLDELHTTMYRLLEKCIHFATTSEIVAQTNASQSAQGTTLIDSLPRPLQNRATIDAAINATSAKLPERLVQIWTMLEKVCSKLFSEKSLDRSQRHRMLLSRLEKSFKFDFLPDQGQMEYLKRTKDLTGIGPEPQGRDMSMKGIILRIARWREMLNDLLYASRSKEMPLSKWSRPLASLVPQSLQIPGIEVIQTGFGQPVLIGQQRVHSFGPKVEISRQEGYSQPRIGFVSDSGKEVFFVVKTSQLPSTRSDQRVNQLKLILNNMFSSEASCKKRQYLHFVVPAVVAIHSRLCLQLDSREMVDFGSVFENEMHRRGLASPKVLAAASLIEEDSRAEERMRQGFVASRSEAFQKTCKSIPNHLFSQYVRQMCSSSSHYQHVRDVFAKQSALASILTYVFSSFDRSPSKISINPFTGERVDLELRPRLKAASLGELESGTARMHVPFRMTRNMQAFISPSGVDGTFANSMQVAAQCMSSHVNMPVLRAFLNLHILHELVDHNATNSLRHRDKVLYGSRQLHGYVRSNVDLMMDRLTNIAPDQRKLVATVGSPDTFPPSTLEELEKEVIGVDPSEPPEEPVPRDSILVELIRQATNPSDVGLMDATWLPWF